MSPKVSLSPSLYHSTQELPAPVQWGQVHCPTAPDAEHVPPVTTAGSHAWLQHTLEGPLVTQKPLSHWLGVVQVMPSPCLGWQVCPSQKATSELQSASLVQPVAHAPCDTPPSVMLSHAKFLQSVRAGPQRPVLSHAKPPT